jgi:RNase P subunit RPR2
LNVLPAWLPGAHAGDNEHKEESVMATATQEAYCVKCRSKRPIKDAQEVTMKNGRRALKGTCEVCGTVLMRMLGNK